MAFKSMTTYNEERKGEFFQLTDDGMYADVIFLYQRPEDVLVADVHYLKTSEYSGYAHCCETGCPACNYGERGIRVDTKLFIPLYNIQARKVEFWDRNVRFEHQLNMDVFQNYPNPSEYVFRVTRHGAYRSVDTTYEIRAIGKNNSMPYAEILADNGVSFPDYYNKVCREIPAADMARMLNSSSAPAPTSDYSFNAVPRDGYVPASTVIPEPSVTVPVPEPANANVPEYVPDVPPEEPAPATSPEGGDDSADDLSDVSF